MKIYILLFSSIFFLPFAGNTQASVNECDTVAKRICTDEKIRRSIDWKEWHALALDSILGKMNAANYKYANTADEACTSFKNAANLVRDTNQQVSQFQKDIIRGACLDSSKSLDMFLYYGVIK